MRRPLLLAAAALVAALPAAESIAEAQAPPRVAQQGRRIPRRLIYGLAGAAVATAAASAYLSGEGGSGPGTCTERACVLSMSVGAGGLVGYMIGREFDQLHALRYRGGAPLEPKSVNVSLAGEPVVLSAEDSLVAVGGLGGVQLFGSSSDGMRAAGRRATSVRGIEALAIVPGSNAIGVGSGSGFYLYPPRTGPGLLLREGATTAAVAAGDRIYFGVGNRIEAVPVSADTTRSWPGAAVRRRVEALHYERGRSLLWAVTDSALVAFRAAGDSLEQLSRLPLGAAARRLSVSGNRAVVALGEGGVRLIDVADPAAPREVMRWTGARFVYDVALSGTRLLAASGVEGVYVLDVANDRPTVLGLSRTLGFAVAIVSHGGFTYVLDRGANVLRRVPTAF